MFVVIGIAIPCILVLLFAARRHPNVNNVGWYAANLQRASKNHAEMSIEEAHLVISYVEITGEDGDGIRVDRMLFK